MTIQRTIYCLVHICPGRRAKNIVYDFPYDFGSIVGGYGLRRMCSHCLRASCDFFYGASGVTRGKSVQRLCGDCTEIVQCQCSLRSLRTEIVRSPCGDRPSHGARAGIVQCHLRHVYGLRAYDFFKFVKLLAKPNRRGRGDHESVRKSHSRLQDTGSVDPSQAKYELGIMPSSHLPRTPCDKFVYDFRAIFWAS